MSKLNVQINNFSSCFARKRYHSVRTRSISSIAFVFVKLAWATYWKSINSPKNLIQLTHSNFFVHICKCTKITVAKSMMKNSSTCLRSCWWCTNNMHDGNHLSIWTSNSIDSWQFTNAKCRNKSLKIEIKRWFYSILISYRNASNTCVTISCIRGIQFITIVSPLNSTKIYKKKRIIRS